LVLSCSLFVVVLPHVAFGEWVRAVRHTEIDSAADGTEVAAFQFELVRVSKVTVEIADARGLVVARIASGSFWEPGEYEMSWDGMALNGQKAPPEAYQYRLVGEHPEGGRSVWAISSDVSGSKLYWPKMQWDADRRRVTYELRRPARVRIRVGIQNNGPLLTTLVDWVPRSSGRHSEDWDGWDASRAQRYDGRSSTKVVVEAFALPQNTVLVGTVAKRAKFLEGLQTEIANIPEGAAPPGFEMFDFARQQISERHDFDLKLGVPDDMPLDEHGRVVVRDTIPISVDVDEAVAAMLVNERFEAVYFVDERMVFETESGFFPITWAWDASDAIVGEHSIHVNLRGFDGHFGMASVLVVVPKR
jgi:hypothetical protein